MTSDLEWDGGVPRSRRFGDIYFSPSDGLAESRAVFLRGCGLPDAWSGRTRFTVFELGFGSGLNILALIELWRRARPEGGRLSIVSVEAYPLGRDEAGRALAAWPELVDLAAILLAQWPEARGWRRIDFGELGVTLDIAIAEAGEALTDWRGRADAWFLDGFAPSKNPEMWRDELLALIHARSAPGARLASFTVAGAVRRGLEAQGFAVERAPGFGRKKQRLEARLPGSGVDRPLPRAAVIGAGIAGAALARAFAVLGIEASVVEAEGAGAGASGNPAALVTPRLDAGLGAIARLHAQAFVRATDLYRAEALEAVIATGAIQLPRTPKDAGRFERIAGWDGFAPGALGFGGEGLAFRDALTVEPAGILKAWLPAERIAARVARLERVEAGWRLLDAAGAAILDADLVCIAAGSAAARLLALPLKPVRGQVSWTGEESLEGPAVAWGGYALPLPRGLLFGATHDRGDEGLELRAEDHARNLAQLAEGRPELAVRLADASLGGRASLRAATPDHLPLAGAVPGAPGLFLLTGLGGRGFTLAPLLAEAVAAEALGAASPLPASLGIIVDPSRFETEAPPPRLDRPGGRERRS